MTAAYFEDHPTDPDKVILRKRPCSYCQDKPRTWVGLSEKDRDYIVQIGGEEDLKYAEWIESILKEKNT